MIFAIMLTARVSGIGIKQQNEQVPLAPAGDAGFHGHYRFRTRQNHLERQDEPPLPEDNVMSIGKLLMTVYVVPFEIVSMVLLAALIGAIVIARRD